MANPHAILDREFGQFPVSIATSLAIEGAVGIYPEKETGINELPKYQQIWINLRTLFRNFHGAMPREDTIGLKTDPVAHAVLEEMGRLQEILTEKSNRMAKVVFYVSNYKDMAKKYPHASLREPKTDRQLEYDALQKKVITRLLEVLEKIGGVDVRVFDRKITTKEQVRALIITHVVYDLVARDQFTELDLLESHTGVIKPRSQWYTKFIDGKTLPMIPFREDMLQIFGDSETFHPWPSKVRRQLIELAEQNRWTQLTTRDKIAYGIASLKDPFLKATLKDMLV
jgi:hypothetical protein